MVDNKEDNWICYVAAPDYTRQNHLICIGTSASVVSESASQRGYKRPVIYSTSFKSVKDFHNNSNQKSNQKGKVKFDPSLLPQIPRKVLEELLE